MPGGQSSEQQNPSYTFDEIGDYEVKVLVTDKFGLTGTASVIVYVADHLYGNYAL